MESNEYIQSIQGRAHHQSFFLPLNNCLLGGYLVSFTYYKVYLKFLFFSFFLNPPQKLPTPKQTSKEWNQNFDEYIIK
jgi:hypothetical protein